MFKFKTYTMIDQEEVCRTTHCRTWYFFLCFFPAHRLQQPTRQTIDNSKATEYFKKRRAQ